MIRLSYTQYSKKFICNIENIQELSVKTLQKLEQFASARSGKLDYEKESFSIPKRISIQHLQDIFNLVGLNVFITEKEPQAKSIAQSATINFGKFKGTKWIDLEDDYLLWLSKNLNGDDKQTAISEISRRKTSPIKKEPKELKDKIGFGKYRGREWGDLPNDYLLWVASNLQGGASKYAQAVLDYKK